MTLFSRTGRRASRALATAGALFFFWCAPALAQTVRPVVVEYKVKARGRFEVVNDSLFPLNVVLEPRSFSVSVEGKPTFRSLDPHIHVKLSSMSFRLPPQQTFYVFYEATADRLPAWFTIYCGFSGLPSYEGINVVVELPHTVYLLQQQSLEASNVRLSTLEFRPGTGQVVAELENISERLGRALEVRVSAGRQNQLYPGFPLLPGSRRQLVLEWNEAKPPERVQIRFQKFRLEEKLTGEKK